MNRDTAILLAPHAARLHALLPAGQSHALLAVVLLVAVCIAAAVAVRREWSR